MEHQPAEAAGTAQLPRLPAQHRSAPHPSTMQMVIEALRAKDSKKGASAAAIKKFILAKYPTVEPTRLKYWLKLALSKGLSRGDLVRPHNSTATGAAGTFMLAPKMLKQKQPPGQVDPDRGEPPKPARPGASQPGRAPAAGARQGPCGRSRQRRRRSRGRGARRPPPRQQPSPAAMKRSPRALSAAPGALARGVQGPPWLQLLRRQEGTAASAPRGPGRSGRARPRWEGARGRRPRGPSQERPRGPSQKGPRRRRLKAR
ncbi:histone H1.8 isoform X3 [Lathamus discolor]|uniref:histone H1.8 isoform X3 n=1 Tax=Lathamus discolor TaxID=678569 RepID=UPI0032B74C93